jgi:flavin reductase (DIM6/NTAB) family NADH-FMN oxidoreductase RutF
MFSLGNKPDGSKKDTLRNIEQNGEFVVNMVQFSMIRQMALSSVQIASDQDEFRLAGLHGIASQTIKPERVKESLIHFECRLNRIVTLGEGQKENSVVFGDIQCLHVDESVIDENNRIDPAKLQVVGRLGRSHYTRTGDFSLETVVMPQTKIPVGFDALPGQIKHSKVLTANELAILASQYELPSPQEIKDFRTEFEKRSVFDKQEEIHHRIRELLKQGDGQKALLMALALS